MVEPNTVLLVHNFYRIPGGEDTVFAQERRLLEEAGYRVLCYTRHNDEIAAAPWWRKLLLPVVTLFNPRTFRELRRLIRREGVQLVHVHNTLALISPAVYAAAASCGVPVVQTVHNYRLLCPAGTCYREGRQCTDCLDRGLGCALRRRCYRGSLLQTAVCVGTLWLHRALGSYRPLHYICMTPLVRERLLSLNGGRRRRLIEPERVFIRPHFTLPSPRPRGAARYFLYVGRWNRVKGVALLAEAFRTLPEFRLVLAGSGEEEDALRAATADCPNIELRGHCSREEVQALLSEAMALIVPSQWVEPFGMVVIEAYAAGVPVLVSDIGWLPRMVHEGETGLVFSPHDSPQALADVVRRFATFPATHWEAPVRACYEAHYTPQRSLEQLRAIYRRAAKPRDNDSDSARVAL
ncbi:MAG: glycosyltransferase family 4 protein [Akkermansia sp.]